MMNAIVRYRSSAVALVALSLAVSMGCQSEWTEAETTYIGSLGTLTYQKGRHTTTGNSSYRVTFNYDAKGRIKEKQFAMEGNTYLYTYRFGYPQRALAPGATELGSVEQSLQLPDGELISYTYD